MVNRARGEIAQKSSGSGKRQWIAPEIEIAPARSASAAIGPPGGADYGIYS